MSKETKGKKMTAKNEASPMAKPVKMRQILIETDGNLVRVVTNTTSGNLELVAALQAVLGLIARG